MSDRASTRGRVLASVIVLVLIALAFFTWHDFGDDKSIMAWPWQAGGFWMHHGGNNALFTDNSVRLYRRYDRSSMTFSATECWIGGK